MVQYILRLSHVSSGMTPWLQRKYSDGSSDEILIDCSLRWVARESIKVAGAKEIYPRIYMLKPKEKQKYITIIHGRGRSAPRFSFAIGKIPVKQKPRK